MASRAQQKEAARQRRLAEEQARAERTRRQRRLQMLLGVVVAAVALVVVAVAISIGGNNSSSGAANKPNSPGARKQQTAVASLLSGIPQAGNRLGNPAAKVTVTEFGDLQCPVCAQFATGAENTLISNDVRSGRVQLVFKSLCTATCNGPTPSVFGTQQAAALAAGLQAKQWYYMLLFYHEQGQEGTAYVTQSYLDNIARQVPGLNFAKWQSDQSQALVNQVSADQSTASAQGFSSTPTITIQGPKASHPPIVGDTDYGTLEAAIKSVS